MVEKKVEVKFSAKGAAEVAGAAKKVSTGLDRTGRSMKKVAKDSTAASAGLGNFSAKLLLLPNALTSTIALVKGLATTAKALSLDLLVAADSVVDTRFAFENQAGSAQEAAKQLRELTKATANQIDRQSLMQLSVAALGGGVDITTSQLAELLKGIKAAADATGKDFPQQAEVLRNSLATGSLTTLATVAGFDELVVVLDKARRGASAAGEVFTKEDEIQLGLAKAVDLARVAHEKWGTGAEQASDIGVSFAAAIKNVSNDFLAAVGTSDVLKAALQRFAAAMGLTADGAGSFGTKLGIVFSKLLSKIVDFARISVEAFQTFGKALARILEIAGVIGVVTFNPLLVGLGAVGVALDVTISQFETAGEELKALSETTKTTMRSNVAETNKFADSQRRAREQAQAPGLAAPGRVPFGPATAAAPIARAASVAPAARGGGGASAVNLTISFEDPAADTRQRLLDAFRQVEGIVSERLGLQRVERDLITSAGEL